MGGEAEVVVEDGEEDNDDDEPEDNTDGTEHESMWPLTLRLWEVRPKLWLKTRRRTMMMRSLRMIQIGTETRIYVASYLEAMGGEAEVVVEDGEEDNDDDEPEDNTDGTKHESMWPVTLRLWEVRPKLWLKTRRRTMMMMSPRMIKIGTETRIYVASYLVAVGGEAEVVVEDREEDNDDDEPEDDTDGTET